MGYRLKITHNPQPITHNLNVGWSVSLSVVDVLFYEFKELLAVE